MDRWRLRSLKPNHRGSVQRGHVVPCTARVYAGGRQGVDAARDRPQRRNDVALSRLPGTDTVIGCGGRCHVAKMVPWMTLVWRGELQAGAGQRGGSVDLGGYGWVFGFRTLDATSNLQHWVRLAGSDARVAECSCD
jgi:hypothetical protein